MTSTRQARATLRDVADRAGVSTSTASLVFSGKGPVAPETAERVRAAAVQLGYAGPNPLASSLRHGRAGVVGVIVEGRLLVDDGRYIDGDEAEITSAGVAAINKIWDLPEAQAAFNG